jgi:UTP:GlnB (protein PII) uridylyltransferase
MSAQGVDIASARIATEIDHAYDTFYVTDRQGRRLEDEAAMTRVRESLEDALLKPV